MDWVTCGIWTRMIPSSYHVNCGKKENNVKDRKYQSNILQIPLFVNAGGWKVGKPVNYLEM